jgi:hypothetical protein
MLKIIVAIILAAILAYVGNYLFSEFLFAGSMIMAGPFVAVLFLLSAGISDIKFAKKYK